MRNVKKKAGHQGYHFNSLKIIMQYLAKLNTNISTIYNIVVPINLKRKMFLIDFQNSTERVL